MYCLHVHLSFPHLFWGFPHASNLSSAWRVLVLLPDFWTCILHKKSCYLGITSFFESWILHLFPMERGWYDVCECLLYLQWREINLESPCFKSKKFAPVPSFTLLEHGYSVQVVALWILTRAYFLFFIRANLGWMFSCLGQKLKTLALK